MKHGKISQACQRLVKNCVNSRMNQLAIRVRVNTDRVF